MSLNQGYRFEHTVRFNGPSPLLSFYLSQQFSHSSESEWLERIEIGEVLVDGGRCTPDTIARAGSVVVWNRPPWEEEPTPQHYSILYEDESLLAVNKPSGLPTIPGGGFYQNTLLSLVRKHYADARPLHRLGRATSGVVLFALDHQTAAKLLGKWSTIAKQYRALASGIASEEEYDIHTRIGEQNHPRLGKVFAANVDGKESRSVARVVKRHSESTLFEVDIYSGRPHQIRIHLASIGHPLVGDPLYAAGGQPKADAPGLPGDAGYWLHANRMVLEHPHSGQELVINALREERHGSLD